MTYQTLPVRTATRDTSFDRTHLDDECLRGECEVACVILNEPKAAESVVARAAARLEVTLATQADNRRERYEPKRQGRLAYRPLTGWRPVLRFLVLDELEREERTQEQSGYVLSESDQIKRSIKTIIKYILTHGSDRAA